MRAFYVLLPVQADCVDDYELVDWFQDECGATLEDELDSVVGLLTVSIRNRSF